MHRIKNFNVEKIIESFLCEKGLLLSTLKTSYYQEPGSHDNSNVKVVLDL